jgi:hypothetical protein
VIASAIHQRRYAVRKQYACTLSSLLFVAFTPIMAAGGKSCSTATLDGAFGYTVKGFAPGGTPFAAVGRIVFDGKGNVETTRTLSNGGVIVRGDTGSGTYTLNEDCMGTFSITASGVGQLVVDLVVDEEGTEIRGIVVNPGFVLTLEGRKQTKK